MTPRYRRSSVRAVLDTMTSDRAVAAEAHDALWVVLWSRRYDDVSEPVWLPHSAYAGIVAFGRALDPQTSLAGVDTGDAFVVFRAAGALPPVASRVRVVPAPAEQSWRCAEVQPVGLGLDLRFDDPASSVDSAWITTLCGGIARLRALLDVRREQLTARRAQLGALNEPPAVETIWREELAAISDRVALQTEYTPQEHAALARARAKGARSADEEERKIVGARKRRFTERGNAEIARFREGRWPALRDAAIAENEKYTEYRTEAVRLEEALGRVRAFTDRTAKAPAMLDALERAEFRVRALAFDATRLEDGAYADELLRTVELLFAAIPQRAHKDATSFSAYRAPTAGPSVIPPRY